MRAIRADKGAQLSLLDLQTVDTTLAQLNHRRQTLPQHAAIAKLRTERVAVASDLVAAETRISDLELEQAKAEADLEPVRERLSRNQVRITNGAIADPKALSSMLEEVNHLKKRIGDLEDAELDVMEQLETALASQETLRARAARVDANLSEAIADRDRQLAALEAEMGGLRQQRAEIAPLIPADLLALYDKDRRQPCRCRRGRAAGPSLHWLPARGQRGRSAGILRRGRRPSVALRGVRSDPDPHRAIGAVMAKPPPSVQGGPSFLDETEEPAVATSDRRLVVEADGGSRGNPGPAAYGAVVRDAQTSKVLAAEGLPIGRATNNVAEYRGLIAGLEMARELDPTAALEVRMDSRLVIEQMAGRWKVKHADMKSLALAAARLRPAAVTWTWVPRELNKAADTLVNRALDGDPVPRQYLLDRR